MFQNVRTVHIFLHEIIKHFLYLKCWNQNIKDTNTIFIFFRTKPLGLYPSNILLTIYTTILPMQSMVSAYSFEHPCIHDPLKASQCLFLHFNGQAFLQSQYLSASHPTKKKISNISNF